MAEHVHNYTVPAAMPLEPLLTTAQLLDSLPTCVTVPRYHLGTQPHTQEELGSKRGGLTGREDDAESGR